jgi:putative membrane protein
LDFGLWTFSMSASRHFDTQARQRINAAVAEAERNTSAEIVPVVASASGRYDRAEDLAGLCLSIILLVVVWVLFQRVDPASGGWDGPGVTLNLVWLVLTIVIGFVLGAVIASRINWLRRLFTPMNEMAMEVNERARQVFYDQRMHHTSGSTGVLLYVSLLERMAVVIADQAVVEKLGAATIDELRDAFTAKLRTAPLVEALGEIIRTTGQKLAPALPRTAGDVNELPDALVVVE